MKVRCLNFTCKNEFRVGRREATRAARPKCPRCGNGQLEEIIKPKTEEENQEAIENKDEVAV